MGTARMDLMFLVIFPCFFLAFNIVYWLSFLYIYPDWVYSTGSPSSTSTQTESTGSPSPTSTQTESTGSPSSTSTQTESTGSPSSTSTLTESIGSLSSTSTLTECTGSPSFTSTLTESTGSPSLISTPDWVYCTKHPLSEFFCNTNHISLLVTLSLYLF